jgi:hypothetical protein
MDAKQERRWKDVDLEAAVKQYSRMLYQICIVILGSEEHT